MDISLYYIRGEYNRDVKIHRRADGEGRSNVRLKDDSSLPLIVTAYIINV